MSETLHLAMTLMTDLVDQLNRCALYSIPRQRPAAARRGDRRTPSLLLCCGLTLVLLACSFVASGPVASRTPAPGQRPASPRADTISASFDPTVLSIGDERAGDNWPSTWAGDGNLYTYGSDGTGFGLPSARSTFPAKIRGDPSTGGIAGQDIRTDAIGTSQGGGASGRKVSGLVALPDSTGPSGHVLYAWVRNITRSGGASLMYSYDDAATWRWAWGNPDISGEAVLPVLGYPTWMQAGENNAAARDNYLYFYSQDTPTAYQVADTVVMGRVEQAQVRLKSAYRYFAGFDGRGNARWMAASALRKPIFWAPGQCYRVFVTYDPGLRRYFLLTANGDSLDSNWKAGKKTHDLGIYAAPTPWGPWQTVYQNPSFQSEWNVFAPQMVSKWIAADGRSFYLLYSSQSAGPYRFNLQKVSLNGG